METAFVASYGHGPPVIGVLGEYDALPGLSQTALEDVTVLEDVPFVMIGDRVVTFRGTEGAPAE